MLAGMAWLIGHLYPQLIYSDFKKISNSYLIHVSTFDAEQLLTYFDVALKTYFDSGWKVWRGW